MQSQDLSRGPMTLGLGRMKLPLSSSERERNLPGKAQPSLPSIKPRWPWAHTPSSSRRRECVSRGGAVNSQGLSVLHEKAGMLVKDKARNLSGAGCYEGQP